MSAALAAALGGLVAAGAALGEVPLLVAVILVQALLLQGWYRFLEVPGAAGGLVVAAGTAAAADILLVLHEDVTPLAPLTGTLGLAVLAAIVHQLARRDRTALTASLTGTVTLAALVAFVALLLPARETQGEAALVVCAALTTGLAAVLHATSLTSPLVEVAAVLGGLLLGVVAGLATDLALSTAVLVGVASAGLVTAALTAVRRAGPEERPAATARATGGALPFAFVAPLTYVLGRILEG